MASQKPSFTPPPEYLLANCSPAERYMVESISKLTQASEWHTDELLKQSAKLESIEGKVDTLDGRVGVVESQLVDIGPKMKEVDGVIKAYKVSTRIFGTKFGRAGVVIALATFCFVCNYMYANYSAIPAILGKVFSVLG